MLVVYGTIFIFYSMFSLTVMAFLTYKVKSKKAAIVAGLILVLIPTWDVVIAYCIYIPAKIFWSGDTIKRQVATDTIHYDNYYHKYGPSKSYEKEFFYRKNKYAEMEVSEIRHYALVKEKGFYRFWLDENDELQYKKLDRIEAQYTVKFLKYIKISEKIPIEFSTIQIIDRKTDEVIAQGNNAIIYYDEVGIFPFFNYLHWKEFPNRIQSNKNWQRLERVTINPSIKTGGKK